MEPKKLYKSDNDRKIFGVCGGLAEYFNMDPTVMRLIWILLLLFFGTGLLAYIIFALIMPQQSNYR
ncbi:MAG: PspC domain-containing protein [Erysipelotrichales bacterium]|nr:PspC domain-containing protein [Erysipelotrichales bacterium]